ncbi:MAG: hypothetical protein Q8O92_07580 [Candidatus Latescibacter sp.]|nr:hypothetical protein [Candidatus Latescibacter sp.]
MENKNQEVKNTSRRKLLKKAGKAAVFVVPAILTFKVTDLHATASGAPAAPQRW